MTPTRSLPPLIPTPFLATDKRVLDVVSVVGPQAESYLQGQLSQNVSSMSIGDCRYSLLLQPQGHMVAWFRVVRTGDESFHLIVEEGGGEAIVARLERFKLGTKAEIASTAESVVSVRASSAEDLPAGSAVNDARLAVVPLQWSGLSGVDLFGPSGQEFEVDTASGRGEALRIGAGIPAFGSDYHEKTIPAELGVVDMSADFNKGCYTGQELVARTDSRGNNTPRQLRVLSGSGSAPSVGDEPLLEDAAAGVLTSVAAIDDGWVALASIKRSAFDATELIVNGATASVVTAKD